MSVIRINEFQAAENKAEDLCEFLKSLVPFVASSEGYILCEVLQSNEDQTIFTVIEKWNSIELHKKSVENFTKEEMQAAMSLFSAPPKGGYFYAQCVPSHPQYRAKRYQRK
jgi:quinol monooxygenase YgiN